jgi:hypothetical protein
MRYVLNSLETVPPGGWRWQCPIHGTRFKADYFPELLEKVVGYRSANKMELPQNPAAWLQDEICRQHGWGPETCRLVEG